MLFAHEPVRADGDHRDTAHRGLPGELLGGDAAWWDRADGGVDRSGGHRNLVVDGQSGIQREAELVSDHGDRLAEAVTEDGGHHAGLGFFRCLAEQHDIADDGGRVVAPDVGELLGADMGDGL